MFGCRALGNRLSRFIYNRRLCSYRCGLLGSLRLCGGSLIRLYGLGCGGHIFPALGLVILLLRLTVVLLPGSFRAFLSGSIGHGLFIFLRSSCIFAFFCICFCFSSPSLGSHLRDLAAALCLRAHVLGSLRDSHIAHLIKQGRTVLQHKGSACADACNEQHRRGNSRGSLPCYLPILFNARDRHGFFVFGVRQSFRFYLGFSDYILVDKVDDLEKLLLIHIDSPPSSSILSAFSAF